MSSPREILSINSKLILKGVLNWRVDLPRNFSLHDKIEWGFKSPASVPSWTFSLVHGVMELGFKNFGSLCFADLGKVTIGSGLILKLRKQMEKVDALAR